MFIALLLATFYLGSGSDWCAFMSIHCKAGFKARISVKVSAYESILNSLGNYVAAQQKHLVYQHPDKNMFKMKKLAITLRHHEKATY